MNYLAIHEETKLRVKNYKLDISLILDSLEKTETNKVYLRVGYPSLWSYCINELDLSESDTQRFLAVMRKSKEVPALKQAVSEGLPIAKAARISKVIDKDNPQEWIGIAKDSNSRDLEKAVVKTKPEAFLSERIIPKTENISELRLPLQDRTLKKIEKLKDLLSQKKKMTVATEEALNEALDIALEKHDPVEKAKRAKQPSTLQATSGRISNALNHQVNLRDKGQCTTILPNGKRCPQKRHIEKHHKIHRSKGGLNTLSNLTTLCSGHHKAEHLNMP